MNYFDQYVKGQNGGSRVAITRLGRIYGNTVLRSIREQKNTSNLKGTVPDAVQPASLANIEMDRSTGPKVDAYAFPNANLIEVKLKAEVSLSDQNNSGQLPKMIDYLSNLKGGFVNGEYNANIKPSDMGVAALTIITPANGVIAKDVLDYATKNRVVIFQRTTEVMDGNDNRMRVGGGIQLNSILPFNTQTFSNETSREINWNVR